MGSYAKISFQNHEGQCDKSTPAIFMIGNEGSGEFLGPLATGFFGNDCGVFFTAAHVFPEDRTPCCIIQVRPEADEMLHRSVAVAYRHARTDVAIGLVEAFRHRESRASVKTEAMAVTSELPGPGDIVFSFGFPDPVVFPEQPGHPTVVLHDPVGAYGVVEQHFPNGRDAVLQPGYCIQVSFGVPRGASGSPVMDSYGRVFGVISTSLEGGPSFVAPLRDIFGMPFPDVRFEGELSRVLTVRDVLPYKGEAPPPRWALDGTDNAHSTDPSSSPTNDG